LSKSPFVDNSSTAVAAIFMQMNQVSLNELSGLFPSPASYDLIFLTAAIISVFSVVLVMIIKKGMLLESGIVHNI
jgi:hypothetical protein